MIIFWVWCNLHPGRADEDCNRCKTARDVNAFNLPKNQR
jgi:hypothetical protein